MRSASQFETYGRTILVYSMLIIAILIVPASARSSGPERYDPLEGQGLPSLKALDWSGWERDLDGDHVDDILLRVMNGQDRDFGRIGINVHFEREPSEEDVDELLEKGRDVGLDPEYLWTGTHTTAVYLTVERAHISSYRYLVSPGVTMVEYRPVMYNMLDVSSPAVRARSSSVYSPYTAENLGYSGEGVVVAVIDSGVDNKVHESLRGKFVYGIDFTGSTAIYGLDPDDIDGHGTHVAGTAIGSGGTADTYRGVAPDAELVDLRYARIMGDITGNADRAFEWLIDNHEEHDIKVVSCSFGSSITTSGRDTTAQLANQLVDEGVVVVVAAGNDGSRGMPSPASADKVITVGAYGDRSTVDRSDDYIEGFSNRGPRADDGDRSDMDEMKPDVGAPGRDIVSAKHNSVIDYTSKTGTSMATPHVSGVAALMFEADPDLEPAVVKEILRDTAMQSYGSSRQEIDPKYNYRSGWGEIDAYGAVKRVEDLGSLEILAGGQVSHGLPLEIALEGVFTKTQYDVTDDIYRMKLSVPLEWGPPFDISVDPDDLGTEWSKGKVIETPDSWDVTAEIFYNSSVEDASPRLEARIVPKGPEGDYGMVSGSLEINGMQGTSIERRINISKGPSPPDLSVVPSAIWFSDNLPDGGDEVDITVKVNNTGGRDVGGAVIRLLDGPELTGTLIDETRIDVPAKSSSLARFTWEANPGLHAITAMADPEGDVIESNEENNTAERPLTVRGFNPPPVAQLEVFPSQGTTLTEITLDGSSSYDTNIRGGAVVSYDFDFGDGTSTGWVDQAVVTHRYGEGGTFLASLRVKDNGGATSASEDTAEVNITAVETDMLELSMNGTFGLSEEPGPRRDIPVEVSQEPLDIGTWEGVLGKRSVNLHSRVKVSVVIEAEQPSIVEVECSLLLSGESYQTGDTIGHEGSGIPYELLMEFPIDEVELKAGSVVEIGVRAHSNRSGVHVIAGDGGSTVEFSYYPVENLPPEVSPIGDKEVKAQSEVTFTGDAMDPDGRIVSYGWDVDGDGSWEAEGPEQQTFVYPGYPEEGTYFGTFEATDDDGYTGSVSFKVIVRPIDHNFPPTVSIDCENGTDVSGEFTFRGTSDDDIAVEMVEIDIEGPLGPMSSVVVPWTKARGTVVWEFVWDSETVLDGRYKVRARAFDGDRYSGLDSCEVDVSNPNSPPEILSLNSYPDVIVLDGDSVLKLEARIDDPDLPGDELDVTADLSPVGGSASEPMNDQGSGPDDTADDGIYTLSFVPEPSEEELNIRIWVTVTDLRGGFDEASMDIRGVARIDVVVRVSDLTVTSGDRIRFEVDVEPPGLVDEVIVNCECLPPDARLVDDGTSGDRIASDGVYSGDLTVEADRGTYQFEVLVLDKDGVSIYREIGDIRVTAGERVVEEEEDGTGTLLVLLIIVVLVVLMVALVLVYLFIRRRGENGKVRVTAVEQEAPVRRGYAERVDVSHRRYSQQPAVQGQMPSETQHSHPAGQ